MRVVTWLGCTSGRLGFHLNSFGPDAVETGGAYSDENDTRLPSERLKRKPVLQEPAPMLYTKPKRLTLGASV